MTHQNRPAHADGTAAPEPLMHVVSGTPTREERAAVEAVLVGLAEEWAETKHRRVLDSESAWQATSRMPQAMRW